MLPPLTWVLGDLTPTDRAVVDETSRALSQAGWPVGAGGDGGPLPSAVLVWTRGDLDDESRRAVATARSQGSPVLLLGPSVTADVPELREASGVSPDNWAPTHTARLRPQGSPTWKERVAPLGDAIEIQTPVLATDKVRESVQIRLTAHLGLTPHPVLTWNPETLVGVYSVIPDPTVPGAMAVHARILHLALRDVLSIDSPDAVPLVIGLLGFGAIGAEHARAADALPGLHLGTVCDRSDERLSTARSLFPGVTTTADPDDLLDDAGIDVIVVSTPPDSHAAWAERVMNAGKHVIVEKPFALTVDEADQVLATAQRTGRRAVVYQNRRFDPDFLTIASLVDGGSLGEVFHLESFIGGYGHPCNYWHSDESVSGGALYDWGSHLIDQILSLHPGPIDHVTCIEHKRKWHDVTNADHTSMSVRFRDGSEAVFVHSDLAAALKPRWYLLGTEGAVTSTWRHEAVIQRSAIGTLDEDVLAVTDSPPELTFVDPLGSQTVLRQVSPERHAFHRQFVDDVRYGWPMTVTAEQSRRVVAVMEAARTSARDGGTPVPVDGDA